MINQLQLPVLFAEFEEMRRHATDCGLKKHIARQVQFLRESEGTHVYVRFIDDSLAAT